jgi:cytosine/adenosine deaminase-related metal-dependent hydrolase
MAFKKFRADQLFDGYRFHTDQPVLITNEAGVIEEIVPVADAGDEVQTFKGILTPGFVNCHCHLELSHMSDAIPEKTGLTNFLSEVMKQRYFPDTDIAKAIEIAETAMIREGIVAVGDICNTTNTLAQKSERRIIYHNFIETMGFHPDQAEARFQRAIGIFSAFATLSITPIASNSIVPHAPYSVSDRLWKMILAFPGNQLLTIHNQEAAEENELFVSNDGAFLSFYQKFKMDISGFKAPGMSSLQYYLPKLLSNQSMILVHNVETSEADIRFAANTPATIYWCLCPNANLYITGQLPVVQTFVVQNCAMVLGTDSLASNKQLSIVAEMKTLLDSFSFITAEQVLVWATSNGAKALQLHSLLGSFEKGKQPGIVVCEQDFTAARRIL